MTSSLSPTAWKYEDTAADVDKSTRLLSASGETK